MRSVLTALALVFAISSSVMAYTVPNTPSGATFRAGRTTCSTYIYPDGHKGWRVHEPLGGPSFQWRTLPPYVKASRLVVVQTSTDGQNWTILDPFAQQDVAVSVRSVGSFPSVEFPGFDRNGTYTVTGQGANLIRVWEKFFFYPYSGTPFVTDWALHDNYQTLVSNQNGVYYDQTFSGACALYP